MDPIFRQLTRGISFNKKRFSEDATKFGLRKDKPSFEAVEKEVIKVPKWEPDLPSSAASSANVSPASTSDSDDSSSDEEAALTILGDIKVKKSEKSGKKKAKKNEKAQKSSLEKRLILHREKVNQFRNAHRLHVFGTDVPDPLDEWISPPFEPTWRTIPVGSAEQHTHS